MIRSPSALLMEANKFLERKLPMKPKKKNALSYLYSGCEGPCTIKKIERKKAFQNARGENNLDNQQENEW